MDFRTAMEAAGLIPGPIVADSKWRRCRTEDKKGKKNGAYVLHPDGRGYWRNWATDTELNSWVESVTTLARQVDPAVAERRRQQERSYRIQAIKSARAFWERARPCTRLHAYLERKGLSALGTVGLREHDGLLVVPVMWRGRVISVQTIAADGTKRFWPGAPVKGGHHEIARPRAALTVLCEGLATGLAIFACVRNADVIVAFDSGNLLAVVQELKPTGNVIVAADNDVGTMARRGFNPGLDAARNAAELIGAGVAFPEGIDGTDWCDALKSYGPTGARRIERLILGASKYVPREVVS